jgi:hypothetical protein
MRNPKTRDHMIFYPEASGQYMDLSCQGSRWLNADPQLGSPMARKQYAGSVQDFFVYEPCMAWLHKDASSSVPVCPLRWFTIKGKLHAQVLPLEVVDSSKYMAKRESLILPLEWFTLSYPEFLELHSVFRLPYPEHIHCELYSLLFHSPSLIICPEYLRLGTSSLGPEDQLAICERRE